MCPRNSIGESTVAAYQKKLSSENYEIFARVNFNQGNTISISNSNEPSKYGHVVFELHGDTMPIMHAVWTEELSANYAEVGYKRYQLGVTGGGGGGQSAARIDPGITPTLFAPAPNPFTGLTNIRYATNVAGKVRITIFDISGREVRTLVNTAHEPGIYNVNWNAQDNRQRTLPGGVYFVRLQTPNHNQSRKAILTR